MEWTKIVCLDMRNTVLPLFARLTANVFLFYIEGIVVMLYSVQYSAVPEDTNLYPHGAASASCVSIPLMSSAKESPAILGF